MGSKSRIGASILFAFAVGALAPTTLSAQVELRVVEDRSGLAIAFPLVRMLDATGVEVGQVVGTATGIVELEAPAVATTLAIEALSFISRRIEVPDSVGPTTVRLEPIPIPLDSILVDGRQRTGRSEFSTRRAAGSGLFLDPADVQLKVEYHMTDAFRDLPGVRRSIVGASGLPRLISSLGSGCFAVRLDNIPLRTSADSGGVWDEWPLNLVTTENVMAMEVYRYFGEVPPELRHQATVGDRMCGLIIIWTTVAW